MNYLDWCKDFYAKHPATSIGLAGGLVLGLSIAVFGFWRTLVVVACVAVGLFVGFRLDNGDDVYSWPERVKAWFRRGRK